MAGTTLDVHAYLNPDDVAANIANYWTEWNTYRQKWVAEKAELRNYVFATDAGTTSNAINPWRNRTVVPKICQIYDNLKANYSATLFPNSNWLRWEGASDEDVTKKKREVIQSYMDTKLRESGFELEMDKILDDFVLYGNCFATVEYHQDRYKLDTGEQVTGYIGPRLVRISPFDICFDPTSAKWEDTPKILKSVLKLGEVQRMIEDGDKKYSKVFDKMLGNRAAIAEGQNLKKSEAYVADGFSDINNYYRSGYVEVLTFYGDIFDINKRELRRSRKIQIVDRCYVISDEAWDSWLGSDNIFHAGWRSRQDNLYAMGPLDNLVGLQYRINHLENLRADVFDQIALPTLKIKGEVEDFEFRPGEKIICGEDGDVTSLVPDATVLQADLQIQTLENKMEELAGAPRQAMGIRTPGEKTAFEVQTLENSASRIFQHKAQKLEREFIEPVLNAMLEVARRRMDTTDVIRKTNAELGIEVFESVSKDDILGKGKIRPVGARHFAERNTRIQELNNLIQIKAADPSIGVHISGKKLAEIIAEELGEKELYRPNVTVQEQVETQKQAQNAEAENMDQLAQAADMGL